MLFSSIYYVRCALCVLFFTIKCEKMKLKAKKRILCVSLVILTHWIVFILLLPVITMCLPGMCNVYVYSFIYIGSLLFTIHITYIYPTIECQYAEVGGKSTEHRNDTLASTNSICQRFIFIPIWTIKYKFFVVAVAVVELRFLLLLSPATYLHVFAQTQTHHLHIIHNCCCLW